RVAVGALDQHPLDRLEARVIAEESLQELLGVRRDEGIQAQLGREGAPAPGVLEVRSVVEKEEDVCARQMPDQVAEEREGLRIDSVQVLKNQAHWLNQALTEQERSRGLDGALPALDGIEAFEWTGRRKRVEQCEEWRHDPT